MSRLIDVPMEVFAQWKMRRTHGDIAAIAREKEYDRGVISDALNLGRASAEVQQAITEYFAQKQQRIIETTTTLEQTQLATLNRA